MKKNNIEFNSIYSFLLIDKDQTSLFVNELTFNKYLDNSVEFFKFNNPETAFDFLKTCHHEVIIIVEPFNLFGSFEQFFKEYQQLKRKDHLFILSASIDKNDKECALSYDFVEGFLEKPLTKKQIMEMVLTIDNFKNNK